MSVIGFNFTKVSGERKTGPLGGKLAIKHSTRLTGVAETPVGGQKALRCSFQHSTLYEPGYAKLLLDGELIVLATEEQTKAAMAEYTKKKQLPPALSQEVFNAILNRVGIQALIMARDLNLPAPFRLPQLSAHQVTQAQSAAERKPEKKAAVKKK